MIHIAILMTVHNRREKTIRCLQHVKAQALDNSIRWHLYLTDDGCTDHTREAVQELIPDATIINGNGELYWNRGMHEAWKAARHDRDFDFYLWLNDDTMLLDTAISHLLACSEKKHHQAIISGFISSQMPPYTTTYCGRTRKEWVSCSGRMQKLRLMHGNAVLIPRDIYNKVGMNDAYYRHAFGDYDYALSAAKKGIEVYSSEDFIGRCDIDNKHPLCFDTQAPLAKRFANLYAPTSYYHPTDAFHFDMKHNGPFIAIGRYLYLHLCCALPRLWRG